MSLYCLKIKKTLQFSCISKTEEQLESKIREAFWSWNGMQPKGSNPTMEDFMETRDKVKLDMSLLKC